LLSLLPSLWHREPMRTVSMAAMLLTACGGQTVEKLTAGGQTYIIPSGQVTTVTREPHTFIRVTDQSLPYELIYDSRLQGKRDRSGAPVVFSINDGERPGVQYHQTEVGTIICRRAPNARGGCGYQLQHGENEWSLLIPTGRLDEADRLAAHASSLLQRYTRSQP
jgi:hypothetical protein